MYCLCLGLLNKMVLLISRDITNREYPRDARFITTQQQKDPLKPIAATSTIRVTHRDGLIDFVQILVYDYVNETDDDTYYRRINREPSFAAQEIATIEENMQRYLDEEKNTVNGERVYPHVTRTSIDFKSESLFPVYTWIITFSGNESESGTQVYEAITEPAQLEYDAKSTYIFPPEAIIVDVESPLAYENVLKSIIVFRGLKGDMITPVERISWILV
jgi:hypothetical protein